MEINHDNSVVLMEPTGPIDWGQCSCCGRPLILNVPLGMAGCCMCWRRPDLDGRIVAFSEGGSIEAPTEAFFKEAPDGDLHSPGGMR